MEKPTSASEMKAEITRLKNKLAGLNEQRAARVETVKAAREAQIEGDTATLAALAGLKFDLAVPFESINFGKVPGATNAGPDLFRGLTMARDALPIVVDALEYRIKYGPHGADQELARIDDCLARAGAELTGAEEQFAEARAAAAAWLSAA